MGGGPLEGTRPWGGRACDLGTFTAVGLWKKKFFFQKSWQASLILDHLKIRRRGFQKTLHKAETKDILVQNNFMIHTLKKNNMHFPWPLWVGASFYPYCFTFKYSGLHTGHYSWQASMTASLVWPSFCACSGSLQRKEPRTRAQTQARHRAETRSATGGSSGNGEPLCLWDDTGNNIPQIILSSPLPVTSPLRLFFQLITQKLFVQEIFVVAGT